MTAVTETLNNIKMLKLYSWVEIFYQRIQEKRKEEIAVSWKRAVLFCFVIAIYNFMPIFIQAVSLFSYVGLGFTIDLATTFLLITLFSILGQPVRQLPWFVGQMVEFLISMQRIQRFLLCPEINERVIDSSSVGANNNIDNAACTLRQNAIFHWGLKDEKEFELKEKLKKKGKGGGRRGGGGATDGEHKNMIKSREESKADAGGRKKGNRLAKIEDNEDKELSPGKAKELQTINEFVALKHLNLTIRKGSFVCIIGDVGSGKSSLLSALIGDLIYLPHNEFERIQEL